MKITCPACNASYRLPDERIQGKNRIFKISCKKCSAEIRVRGVETAEEIGRTTMPFALELPAPAAAPAATLQVWFAGIDGKQVGPLSETELGEHIHAGRLGPADLVWKKGFSQWMPVREVPPFDDMLAEAPVAGDEPKPVEKRSPRRAQTLELSAAMIELLVKLDGQSESADGPPAVPVEPPALPPLEPEPVLKAGSLDRASAIAGEHGDADRMDEVVETLVSPVPTTALLAKRLEAKADEKPPEIKMEPRREEAKASSPAVIAKAADKKPSVVVKAAPVIASASPSKPQIQPVEAARPATAPAKPAATVAPAKPAAGAAPAKSAAPAATPAKAAAAPAKAAAAPARTPVAAKAPDPKGQKKGGGLYIAAGVAVVIGLVVVGVVASQGGKTEATTPAPSAAVASAAPVVAENPVVPTPAPVVTATASAQADAGATIEADIVAAAVVAADVAAPAPAAAVEVAKVEEKKEEPKVEEKKADEKKDSAKKDDAKAEKKAEKKDEAKVEKKDDADAILAKREAKEKAAQDAEAKKEAAKAAKEQSAKDAEAKKEAAKAEKEAAKAAKEQAAKDKLAAKSGKPAKGDDDIDAILAKHDKSKKAAEEPTGSDDSGGLSQSEVNQIASKVNKKVLTCVMLGEVEGETALKVTVRVNSDGSVNNAKVLGKFGGTPVAKCVADAVQTLTFPQSSGPAKKYTLKYAVGN
jgi:predicted Zn finger-like uncharacterized protein